MRLLAACVLVLVLGAATAGAVTPPATVVPGQLTVGISMPSEGFEVGVADGSRVIYAEGLEIDLARALATRLGLSRTVFLQGPFDRLYSGGTKPWDVALAEITITDARRRTIDFSAPYMRVDQGVLAAQTLTRVPRTIADLRTLRICALRKSTGADVAQQRIAPVKPVSLMGNVPSLMQALQTGRCDVVVYDAPALGTLKARAPQRYGAFAGVIQTREQYGIALPNGSALAGPVNRALRSLITDGTVARLSKKWLTVDPQSLRVIR